MKKRLPEYVVNCLLAAGYDSAEVIASMEVSGPSNMVEVIEGFRQAFSWKWGLLQQYIVSKTPICFSSWA